MAGARAIAAYLDTIVNDGWKLASMVAQLITVCCTSPRTFVQASWNSRHRNRRVLRLPKSEYCPDQASVLQVVGTWRSLSSAALFALWLFLKVCFYITDCTADSEHVG